MTTEELAQAYRLGAFPMADDHGQVQWYTTPWRALFPISGIRVSKSLAKRVRQGGFEVRFDSCFRDVVLGCFRPKDNWLTGEFVDAYSAAHEEGWGHCSEVWVNGELVGGVYGLAVGSCFSAESMFHRMTDMSKIALWALVEKCQELGFTVFDAQIMNPHLESLGAYEVPQREYLRMLHDALQRTTEWSVRR